MSSEYKVGYKRPPRQTRFHKGRSGNPKGRSRGNRNLKTVLADQLKGSITATLDGRPRQITRIEAIALSMVTSAIKGDARARDSLLRTMQVLGLLDQQEQEARPLSADEQKLLELYGHRIRRRLEAGAENNSGSAGKKLSNTKKSSGGVP